ncbi:hypothetical protein O181_111943 [Austropuccinia psidii MF-1]|uniref:Uncharacterized protein n=1 Tax=Austropuccinia psidii MF-1 TaxID=1389203 RepID=A0A9Q3JZI5_9BASI|nr:hypothetical protein [Austropuccinia psidii MF-1]
MTFPDLSFRDPPYQLSLQAFCSRYRLMRHLMFHRSRLVCASVWPRLCSNSKLNAATLRPTTHDDITYPLTISPPSSVWLHPHQCWQALSNFVSPLSHSDHGILNSDPNQSNQWPIFNETKYHLPHMTYHQE